MTTDSRMTSYLEVEEAFPNLEKEMVAHFSATGSIPPLNVVGDRVFALFEKEESVSDNSTQVQTQYGAG